MSLFYKNRSSLLRIAIFLVCSSLILGLTIGCSFYRTITSYGPDIIQEDEEKVSVYKAKVHFMAVEEDWTEDEIENFKVLFKEVYPQVEKIYGSPDTTKTDKTATIRKITPETKQLQAIPEYSPAYTTFVEEVRSDESHLEINLFVTADIEPSMLAHELVHVFQGKRGQVIDQQKGSEAWIEGIASAIEVIVGRNLGKPSKNDRGTDFYYHTFNKPQMSTSRSWQNNPKLAGLRYIIASYAWQQPYNQDPEFFSKFNKKLRNTTIHTLEMEGLSKTIELAGEIWPGFQKWHNDQWIFSTENVPGDHLFTGAYIKDGLKVLVFSINRNDNGDEAFISDLPVYAETEQDGTSWKWEMTTTDDIVEFAPLLQDGDRIEKGEISYISFSSDTGLSDEVVLE